MAAGETKAKLARRAPKHLARTEVEGLYAIAAALERIANALEKAR
jgi:hypothetical protein